MIMARGLLSISCRGARPARARLRHGTRSLGAARLRARRRRARIYAARRAVIGARGQVAWGGGGGHTWHLPPAPQTTAEALARASRDRYRLVQNFALL